MSQGGDPRLRQGRAWKALKKALRVEIRTAAVHGLLTPEPALKVASRTLGLGPQAQALALES